MAQHLARYGSPGRRASEVTRELMSRLGLVPSEAMAAIRQAGAAERPPVRTIDALDTARPAVCHYAWRLMVAIADERKARPMPEPTSTNRPEYAPAKRPGDPLELADCARELVAMHFYPGDLLNVAALIEAGAAALKYAPGTGLTKANSRKRTVNLGAQVARAMRAEVTRRTTPAPAPKRKRNRVERWASDTSKSS